MSLHLSKYHFVGHLMSWLKFFAITTRPPIQLLHHIKSIPCHEEEGLFPMNEMDLKLSKIVFFF